MASMIRLTSVSFSTAGLLSSGWSARQQLKGTATTAARVRGAHSHLLVLGLCSPEPPSSAASNSASITARRERETARSGFKRCAKRKYARMRKSATAASRCDTARAFWMSRCHHSRRRRLHHVRRARAPRLHGEARRRFLPELSGLSIEARRHRWPRQTGRWLPPRRRERVLRARNLTLRRALEDDR